MYVADYFQPVTAAPFVLGIFVLPVQSHIADKLTTFSHKGYRLSYNLQAGLPSF